MNGLDDDRIAWIFFDLVSDAIDIDRNGIRVNIISIHIPQGFQYLFFGQNLSGVTNK